MRAGEMGGNWPAGREQLQLVPMDREPAIDFPADNGGIDLMRLERSLGLECERVADGRYRVTGGADPHWVDLYTRTMPRCDCGDHLWRDEVCKHILAALLREGHPRLVRALGALVASLRAA